MKKKINIVDLKVGMFVDTIHSSWLNSPMRMDHFAVNSETKIDQLKKYGIGYVTIDTDKGVDMVSGEKKYIDADTIAFEKTFSATVCDFWINSSIPFDLYAGDNPNLKLTFKKGATYSIEVKDLFKNKGMTKVRVPTTQKAEYNRYITIIEKERGRRKELGYSDHYVDPEVVKQYIDFKENYYPLNPDSLVPGTKNNVDIFARVDEAPALTLARGITIEVETLGRWEEENTNLLIRKREIEQYQLYLQRHTRNSKNKKVKASYVIEDSKLITEELSKNPRSEKLMRHTKNAVEDITQVVLTDPLTFYSLLKINNHDYYTFTHSVNVATLCIALATEYGIEDKGELADLGLGALLHDLGKARVDKKIIDKPGKLTDDEYTQMKNHVNYGKEMLEENKLLSRLSLIPLMQHHERLNGKGYPNGLKGSDIHIFGRISAVIDFYDALTTERSYRKAFSPFDTLSLIQKEEQSYDAEVISVLVKLLSAQTV
ncbi:hypothetical protein MNBD_NITROSPINAE02-2169 [hydrothermal vent metagenome]|uniref:HD-GYP domain-containing protein n=1 Tax=hydrothermal vent metagenome TaxID=652676 RepID=A0A3B1CAK1_9ZZZZ